ncbi:increased DNA methylation 1-like [Bidens hawaiensis]|uniref:increased DNA methylation 1-like n=1 Tax=Bidens hawaiensis TaxID=980011 RepID=UPI00404A684A
MDVSKFVSHGGGTLDQALKSIHYESGASLFTCLLNSWKKEMALTNIKFNNVDVKGDDPHDDTCNICGDGGDLICCDGCPSTFHQSCLDIENFPSGDWYCIYCCCKFCGLVACGASHTSEMVKCCLCEEKFHRPCLEEENVADAGSSSLSICGKKCLELYEQLQTYIGVKFELKEGYSWTLLKCYDLSQDLDDPTKVHCNSKLAVAFSVMDECFVPVMDERSGVNRIHDVVYNCG